MKTVKADQRFRFSGLCPYCGSDLIYTCTGWEQDDGGDWKAASIESDCAAMPDFEDEHWKRWERAHAEMPYVHQMPVDESVLRWINDRYIFDLDPAKPKNRQ